MTTILLQMRDDWNARPPESIVRLNWSKVTKFIVHYSGASRTQSVRSIQDFCMDNKGHSDIDYNELVRGNVLYLGRGNNVGSHTLNNNSTSYGVCMIGVDGDATADDMNVIRSRYDYACAMAGRQLTMLGHQQAPTLPPGYTSCPGNELQKWINAGMPYVGEEGFPSEDDDMNSDQNAALASMFWLTETTENWEEVAEPVPFSIAINGLVRDIAELKERPPVQAAPIDPDALNAAVLAAMQNPAVLEAIANAVVNEDHARSAE